MHSITPHGHFFYVYYHCHRHYFEFSLLCIRQSYYSSLRFSLASYRHQPIFTPVILPMPPRRNVLNNVDTFEASTRPVEIIDMRAGAREFAGSITDPTAEMEDVTAALAGGTASW